MRRLAGLSRALVGATAGAGVGAAGETLSGVTASGAADSGVKMDPGISCGSVAGIAFEICSAPQSHPAGCPCPMIVEPSQVEQPPQFGPQTAA